jgi:ubiquinone/menaquinone biosynthesis C-methylase UbiE
VVSAIERMCEMDKAKRDANGKASRDEIEFWTNPRQKINQYTMKDSHMVRPERYQSAGDAVNYDRNIRSAKGSRRLSHWMETYAFKRALARIEGKEVLDGPCGTGRTHKILSTKFSTVVSLDSSESMLHIHEKNTGSKKLCCGDMFRLPFSENRFDWTVSYRLFHHMTSQRNRVALLRSITRVSRQGVIFTAWIDTPLNKRCESRRQSLSRAEMTRVITDANLHLISIDYASWPFQPKCVITCRKPKE